MNQFCQDLRKNSQNSTFVRLLNDLRFLRSGARSAQDNSNANSLKKIHEDSFLELLETPPTTMGRVRKSDSLGFGGCPREPPTD